MVCSILGLAIETVFHLAIYHAYQDRAGLLYGPFSPIYGFGGLFMTVALNRFHDKPIPVIFLISALIGGAFEFTVSWIMQSAFGIVAWDYSGTFLSIDGRTNFMFMCFWGILGVMWVKFLLPILLWMINKIPWKLRYALTVVCFVFMVVDVVLTVQTIDCWYLREAGTRRTPRSKSSSTSTTTTPTWSIASKPCRWILRNPAASKEMTNDRIVCHLSLQRGKRFLEVAHAGERIVHDRIDILSDHIEQFGGDEVRLRDAEHVRDALKVFEPVVRERARTA